MEWGNRKNFLISIFFDKSWAAELEISKTKINPMMVRATTLPNNNPTTARVAPNDNAPTSPINILAGKTLKYKKETKDPSHSAIKIARGISRIEADKNHNPNKEISRTPEAKPSNPSVILTALAKDTIAKVANGI